MIRFEKKNGYPRDLTIKTEEYEDEQNGFKGFKSEMINHKGKVIREFTHKHIGARIDWADGYFTALRNERK